LYYYKTNTYNFYMLNYDLNLGIFRGSKVKVSIMYYSTTFLSTQS
jgi:hypothetical protein